MYILLVSYGATVLLTNIGVVAFPQQYGYSFYENSSYSDYGSTYQGPINPAMTRRKLVTLTRMPVLDAPRILIFGVPDLKNVITVVPIKGGVAELQVPTYGLPATLYVMLVETHKYYQYCSTVVVEPRKDLVDNDTLALDFGSECDARLTPSVIRSPVGEQYDLRCFNKNIATKLPREYLKYFWRHSNYTLLGSLEAKNGTSLTTKLRLTIEPFDNFTVYECIGKFDRKDREISFGRHRIEVVESNVTGSHINQPKIINYAIGEKYTICEAMSKAVAIESLLLNKKTGNFQDVSTGALHPLTISSVQNNTNYVCIYYYHPKGAGFSRIAKYILLLKDIYKDNRENGQGVSQIRKKRVQNETNYEYANRTLQETYMSNTPFQHDLYVTNNNSFSGFPTSKMRSNDLIEPVGFTMDIAYFVIACVVPLIAYVVLKKRKNRHSDQTAIIAYSAGEDTRPLPQCPEPRHYETPNENPYVYDYVYQHWNTEHDDSHIYHYARPTNEVNSSYLSMTKNAPINKDNIPSKNIPNSKISPTNSNSLRTRHAPPIPNFPPRNLPISTIPISKR